MHTQGQRQLLSTPLSDGQKQGIGDERWVNIQLDYRIRSHGQAEIQTRQEATFVIYLEGM